MLNFNAMDGISPYSQSPLIGKVQFESGAFATTPPPTPCHQSQSNQALLNNTSKTNIWPMTSTHVAVGAHMNSQNQNQLNLKNYCGPSTSVVNSSEVASIDGDTAFMHPQQKGSVNVKRFSVNNLLQLANNNNNCRVLPNDRLAGTYIHKTHQNWNLFAWNVTIVFSRNTLTNIRCNWYWEHFDGKNRLIIIVWVGYRAPNVLIELNKWATDFVETIV